MSIHQDSQKNNQSCYILKVNIHCGGCEQKVKKLIHKVNGVISVKIDREHGKVIVKGNVDPNRLIQTLKMSGKNAEILDQNSNMSHDLKVPFEKPHKSVTFNLPYHNSNFDQQRGHNNNTMMLPMENFHAPSGMSNVPNAQYATFDGSKHNGEAGILNGTHGQPSTCNGSNGQPDMFNGSNVPVGIINRPNAQVDLSSGPNGPTGMANRSNGPTGIQNGPKGQPGTFNRPNAEDGMCNRPNDQASMCNGPNAQADTRNRPNAQVDTYNRPNAQVDTRNGPNARADMMYNGLNAAHGMYNGPNAQADMMYNGHNAAHGMYNGPMMNSYKGYGGRNYYGSGDVSNMGMQMMDKCTCKSGNYDHISKNREVHRKKKKCVPGFVGRYMRFLNNGCKKNYAMEWEMNRNHLNMFEFDLLRHKMGKLGRNHIMGQMGPQMYSNSLIDPQIHPNGPIGPQIHPSGPIGPQMQPSGPIGPQMQQSDPMDTLHQNNPLMHQNGPMDPRMHPNGPIDASMHQNGPLNPPMHQNGPMGQMGNVPAMNRGDQYYQEMQPPSYNNYPQQQQQEQEPNTIIYQPAMSPPCQSYPNADPFTHMFNDENTEATCTIM